MHEINNRTPIVGPRGKDIVAVYIQIESDNGITFYNLAIRLYSDASCTDDYLITSTKLHSIGWSLNTATPHLKNRDWQLLKKSIPVCNKIRFKLSMKTGVKSFYIKFTANKTPDPLSTMITTIGYITVA